jgi:formate C-acetyltransferase
VARGKDANHGGARYVHHNNYAGGLATVADSLVAIKKAVFEEGWLSLGELRDALAANFAGKESLRQRLLNRYPKFGNDHDEADGIAAEIAECFCQEVLNYRDPVGACWPGMRTTLWIGHGRGNADDALPASRRVRTGWRLVGSARPTATSLTGKLPPPDAERRQTDVAPGALRRA